MQAMHITADDVKRGVYFIHEDGSVWRCVGYAAEPTATLERVDDKPIMGLPQRVSGVVGAPIFEPFHRLVREDEIVVE